jgi:hypothetical protein
MIKEELEQLQNRVITFTISLPEGGTFEDQIKGLRAARNTQHKHGNPGATQTLSIILALAERGKLAFEMDTNTKLNTENNQCPPLASTNPT